MQTGHLAEVTKFIGYENKIDPDILKEKFEQVFSEHIFTEPVTSLPININGLNKNEKCSGFSISGIIGSGKSTVANILMAHGYRQLAFANPLKDIAAYLFNLNRSMLEGDTPESRSWREIKLPGSPYTPRFILQKIGTEIFRDFDENIWLNVIRKQLYGKVVITDARFLNELEFVKEHGIKTIQIIRPDIPIQENAHVSETQHMLFGSFDHVLVNEGSLGDLGNKVRALV